MKNTSSQRLGASFRDPSGFLFTRQGTLYRQVNQLYRPHYDHLLQSGLLEKLTRTGWLIPQQEVEIEPAEPEQAYKILQPERIEFISYPYEWCFSQLKDAALLTLAIQKKALESGMALKDASAYNIQFHKGRPILIDTLSFEILQEGKPWVAYRQFCQHFLAPLALMVLVDIRFSQLLRIYIDGIPLDLASKLLPGKTRFNLGLATHIHLHAQAQEKYAGKAVKDAPGRKMGRIALLGLMENLESTVRGLEWKPAGTEWTDYYDSTNYSGAAFDEKKAALRSLLTQTDSCTIWDLGANTGIFSRVAADTGALVISMDIDPGAVEKNYLEARQKKEARILPLVIDLTNPSGGVGWGNEERSSLVERAPADVVLALALIHHLAIANNVPLIRVAEFFSRLSKWLVIEFVPKEDSQVQRLLASREDIFLTYTSEGFEAAFKEYYEICSVKSITGSMRKLYLMKTR